MTRVARRLACRTGRPRQCETKQMLGIDCPGAYAEYVSLHEHDVCALPDELDHRDVGVP